MFELNLLAFTDIMKSLGGILLAVGILLAMVTIHEFGHYIAGKLLGFKINEFSVGFGPAIFKKRSKKTGELFALRIIPLGGYCAFDGEDEYEDEPKNIPEKTTEEPFAELVVNPEKMEKDEGRYALNEKKVDEDVYPEPKGERFNEQPPWKRIIVLIAGATMNYLLALVLLVTMFTCIGRPLYRVIKLPESKTATMAIDGSIEVGDIIEKIDGKNMYMITDYMDVLQGKKAGESVAVSVIREGKSVEVTMTLQQDANFVNMSDTGTLLQTMGIASLHSTTVKPAFFEGIGNSFAYSFKLGEMVLRSLGELLTGKLGLEAVGGPITTIQVTSQAASSSLLSFLNIAGFIGVNLAVFNLLPIPALDGCKVIFCIVEWIRKKPINRKIETIIHLIGIVVLFGFAILVDVLRFFI